MDAGPRAERAAVPELSYPGPHRALLRPGFRVRHLPPAAGAGDDAAAGAGGQVPRPAFAPGRGLPRHRSRRARRPVERKRRRRPGRGELRHLPRARFLRFLPRECAGGVVDPGARAGPALPDAAPRAKGAGRPRGEGLRGAARRTCGSERGELRHLPHPGELLRLPPRSGPIGGARALRGRAGTGGGREDDPAGPTESHPRVERAPRPDGRGLDAELRRLPHPGLLPLLPCPRSGAPRELSPRGLPDPPSGRRLLPLELLRGLPQHRRVLPDVPRAGGALRQANPARRRRLPRREPAVLRRARPGGSAGAGELRLLSRRARLPDLPLGGEGARFQSARAGIRPGADASEESPALHRVSRDRDTETLVGSGQWVVGRGQSRDHCSLPPAPCPLAQYNAASTARRQPRIRRSRSSAVDRELNTAWRRVATKASSEGQTPSASPASAAAPSAVVSTMSGRSTGTPRRSAWNWRSQSLAEPPPSTRRRGSSSPAAPSIASMSSRVPKAMDSRAARTRCAGVVPRVRPVIVPRASGSQCGLPSPTNAGTMCTPPVSGTEAASAAESEACLRRPSSSRSHWITAPAMKRLPSSAKPGPPRRLQAAVASTPPGGEGGCSPV